LEWDTAVRRRAARIAKLLYNRYGSARACCRHALLWERLAEWMTATTDEAAALADTRFASELGLTVDALRRRAPQTPDPAWRSWARVGAAAMLGAWHPLALRASPKSSRPSR